jgi:hypothetical protein
MNTPATAPVANRPGSSTYVPAVRVVRLQKLTGPDKGKGAEGVLPNGLLGDLVRAEITRVNTGASQYSLTFNNWYHATLQQRKQTSDETGGANPSDGLERADAPFWPRFKYNDFALLRFGERLRIDMRYVADAATNTEATADEQGWRPMVAGPITDVRFNFAAGQGAVVTVAGEDDLSLLKDKHDKRLPMNRRSELSMVKHALESVNYPLLPIAKPLVGYEQFVTDDDQGLNDAIAAGQSTLDFIQKLADRLDFEVFVEFADPDNSSAPLRFHFEPYRARARPDEGRRNVFQLTEGVNLVEFNPTIKVVDQYSSVEVKGRHRDPLRAKEVEGKATHQILSDELHPPGAKLLSGPEVRGTFFKGRENKFTVQNQSNLDDVRADWAAKAVIRKKARELFTIEAATIGTPAIRPGNHVEIVGMLTPFDGFYYVTKTVHTFGADGYRTRITASRPGMELPSQQVAS